MEVVAFEVDGVHFGIGHLDAGRIDVLIEFATNRQTGLGRCCSDQLDNDLMADEWFAAPVSGDEREKAMARSCSTCTLKKTVSNRIAGNAGSSRRGPTAPL